MKIGDKIEATVENIDDKGRGTFLVKGKAALAYFVIPGEKLSGTMIARTKGTLRLKADEILVPSPDRVQPPCPDAGRCGGCPWQMISYERQCALKLDLVKKALAAESVPVTISHLLKATSQYHYRNRMDYVFGWNGELGLKEPEHWAGVLDLKGCLLLSPEAIKIMDLVRAWMKSHQVTPWDNRRHTGFLRYLVIRESQNTGERLVLLTTSAEQATLPAENELSESLRPYATSFIQGVNPDITDLSVPKTMRLLFGNLYLTEKVNGLEFRIPPGSFFQTNSQMAAALQDTVSEFANLKRTETALDLYCGSGFLTLALARQAKAVSGVEIDAASIDNARVNAELNGLKNVSFTTGATEALLSDTLSATKPDCIVVDPPRIGLHPAALASLMDYGAERLVYVSCNPRSLARDLKTLLGKYSIENKRCIDLFPHTPHIETVIALTLR